MNWPFLVFMLFILNCNATPTFRETINEYGHTDKDGDHSYVESYERLLAPYVNKSCTLLEIGVNFGGSAIMWYEHLPQSQMFLLDNRNVLEERIFSNMDPSRWHFYLEDAYTPEVVALMQHECPEGFDVIVDDGPHYVETQEYVIQNYVALLKVGGIVVIEDIQSIKDLEQLKSVLPTSDDYQCEIIDLRPNKGRYDEILVVIKRVK